MLNCISLGIQTLRSNLNGMVDSNEDCYILEVSKYQKIPKLHDKYRNTCLATIFQDIFLNLLLKDVIIIQVLRSEELNI